MGLPVRAAVLVLLAACGGRVDPDTVDARRAKVSGNAPPIATLQTGTCAAIAPMREDFEASAVRSDWRLANAAGIALDRSAPIAGAQSLDPDRRRVGQRVVGVFLVVAVALSIFWYPLWSALRIPYEFYRLHNWLTGWV